MKLSQNHAENIFETQWESTISRNYRKQPYWELHTYHISESNNIEVQTIQHGIKHHMYHKF